VRDQGKACFAELQDSEGRIQLYLNRDVLCPEDDKTMYNQVFKKLTDLGFYRYRRGIYHQGRDTMYSR
jgi:lysyl-tRNA synthetase class 2